MSQEEKDKAELEITYSNPELVKKLTNIKIKNFWGGVLAVVLSILVSVATISYKVSESISDYRNFRNTTVSDIHELKDWKTRIEIANEYHITSKHK